MYEDIAVIASPNIHPTKSYSHAVRFANLLFISGQVAVDAKGRIVGANDVAAQAEQVLQNLGSVLRTGGSDLSRLLKLTVFLTDRSHRSIFNDVRERHLSGLGHYPASTVVVVAGLADPNWLIEIEATAAVG